MELQTKKLSLGRAIFLFLKLVLKNKFPPFIFYFCVMGNDARPMKKKTLDV